MATITSLALGGTSGVPSPQRQSSVVTHEIKISDAVSAGLVTTDLVTVLTIPAETFVEVLSIEIVDASLSLGAGARIDVGDSAAVDTFVSNASTLTVGTNLTIALIPKFYASADYIKLKVTGGTIASVGTVRFVLRMTNTSRNAKATSKVYTNS